MRYNTTATALLTAAILAFGASVAQAGRMMGGGFHGGGHVMGRVHGGGRMMGSIHGPSFGHGVRHGGFGHGFQPRFAHQRNVIGQRFALQHPHFMAHHPRDARYQPHFAMQQPRLVHMAPPQFVQQLHVVQRAPVVMRPAAMPYQVMQPRMVSVMPLVLKRPAKAY